MNTMKLTAVLTAAILAGAMSTTALADEAAQPASLAQTDSSVTFQKVIDMTNATGSGGVTGEISFAVTPALSSDLPADTSNGDRLGTVAQIDGATVKATFTADANHDANKSSDVQVNFNMDEFTQPGIYYYRLTEQEHGITGLSKAEKPYVLKVLVVNANPTDPDNKEFKIDYAVMQEVGATDKAQFIENDYQTYTLNVEKKLDGDFADYSDVFDFTVTLTDPDAKTTAHMTKVTVETGKEGSLTPITDKTYFENGQLSFTVPIKGDEMIKVTGLPAGTTYTIDEAANSYTTSWVLADESTRTDTKTSGEQTMDGDATVVVTNTRNSVAPTGLLMDAAPYGAMLALAAGSGAVFFRKRRRDA